MTSEAVLSGICAVTRNTSIIGITGPSGNGKSTYGEVLKAAFESSSLQEPPQDECRVTCTETSGIIKWGLRQQTRLGDDLREFEPLMALGKYLPDHMMEALFFTWVRTYLGRFPQTRLLIVPGLPRTIAQNSFLEPFMGKLVVHIRATPEETRKAVIRRYLSTLPEKRRADDAGGEKIFHERQAEYTGLTLPALSGLNGTVLHLDRSESLRTRTSKALGHIQENGYLPMVSHRAVNRALWRLLHCPDHRVNKMIDHIENPPPVPKLVTA